MTLAIDELRRLANSPNPDLRGLDLETERAHHQTVAGRIRMYRGADLKADEARALSRSIEAIELIDAIGDREYHAAKSERDNRADLAANLRRDVGLDSFNPATARTSLGAALLDAIGEVRDGRAVAYVDLENRALSEGGSGGYGVNTQMAAAVSNLKARSVVMSLPGVRTVPMTSDRMRWPRFGTATAAGVGEAATLTAAATDIDAVDVVAQKYASYELLSTELEEDMNADAIAAIGDNLLKQLALRVDLGLLEGTGAADVVGIRNVVGANSTSLAATPSNFVKFRDAEYELRLDNGEPAVWVMHPRSWSRLSAVKTGIASDETTLLETSPQKGPRTLLGYPVAFSSQITLTEGAGAGSWAALLDTSQIVICERRPARLEVSRDVNFDTDQIAVRATTRLGLAVLNPEAVSLVTDIR